MDGDRGLPGDPARADGASAEALRPATSERAPTAGNASVGAADLRQALQLTPHQLGELTSRLRLEIGERPNYPRYRRTEVHLITAALALREVRVPLEDACDAVVTFADHLLTGNGWLVLHPDPDRWVAFAARTLPAVGSLLMLASRASVLDAAAVQHRSDSTWSQLLTQSPPAAWSE